VRVDEHECIVCCWGPRVRQQDHEGALSRVALRWEWFTMTRLALTDVRAGRFSVWPEHWENALGKTATHTVFVC
jgi:hypothetical protein